MWDEYYYFYSIVSESMDLRVGIDRIRMEQHGLSREVVNLVAREGAEMVERHHLFVKWKARLMMAGFTLLPLSSKVCGTIRKRLQVYGPNYLCDERYGALYLVCKDKPLVVTSAWH